MYHAADNRRLIYFEKSRHWLQSWTGSKCSTQSHIAITSSSPSLIWVCFLFFFFLKFIFLLFAKPSSICIAPKSQCHTYKKSLMRIRFDVLLCLWLSAAWQMSASDKDLFLSSRQLSTDWLGCIHAARSRPPGLRAFWVRWTHCLHDQLDWKVSWVQ